MRILIVIVVVVLSIPFLQLSLIINHLRKNSTRSFKAFHRKTYLETSTCCQKEFMRWNTSLLGVQAVQDWIESFSYATQPRTLPAYKGELVLPSVCTTNTHSSRRLGLERTMPVYAPGGLCLHGCAQPHRVAPGVGISEQLCSEACLGSTSNVDSSFMCKKPISGFSYPISYTEQNLQHPAYPQPLSSSILTKQIQKFVSLTTQQSGSNEHLQPLFLSECKVCLSI